MGSHHVACIPDAGECEMLVVLDHVARDLTAGGLPVPPGIEDLQAEARHPATSAHDREDAVHLRREKWGSRVRLEGCSDGTRPGGCRPPGERGVQLGH